MKLYCIQLALLERHHDCLFGLMLYIPVNSFSVMLGQFPVFLGGTSAKEQIKCFAQEHNTVTRLELTSNPSIPSLTPGLQIRMRIGKLFSLFLMQNICCGYSKEPSQWDGSFEHPKHMFKSMGIRKYLKFYANKISFNWIYVTLYQLSHCAPHIIDENYQKYTK